MGRTASRTWSRATLRSALPPRRVLAVLLVAFVGFLYYRPLVAFLEARDALERRGAEVAALREQERRLERRLHASQSPEALVRDARRLAYVKPGEQLFIVKGIDGWRQRARARATVPEHGGR